MERFADIIVPVPLHAVFTYMLPPHLFGMVQVGSRVLVPFGVRRCVGIVVRLHTERPSEEFELKSIDRLLNDVPQVQLGQLALWKWMAGYYLCTYGDVMRIALPAGLGSVDGYRPRMETWVRPAGGYRNRQALVAMQESLRRSPRQQHIIGQFLSLWETGNAAPNVLRQQLIGGDEGLRAPLAVLVKKGVFELYEVKVSRLVEHDASVCQQPQPLTPVQAKTLNQIHQAFAQRQVCLFHGNAAPQHFEVCVHLLQDALAKGEQVLLLFPQRTYAEQYTVLLRQVFGAKVAAYHAGIAEDERVEIWQKQLTEQPYSIIIGVQSAVFLPFRRLGLVIVADEHDAAYKHSDSTPRYQARDVAVLLASRSGARTLLCSATPSAETWYNATIANKYGHVCLDEDKDTASVQLCAVDVKDLRRRKIMKGMFSPLLKSSIQQALQADRQVVLLQNRRGFNGLTACKACGWTPRCPNCDVTLTFHKSTGKLVCHYCGHSEPLPQQCPSCGTDGLRLSGSGTERIEENLRKTFPNARVSRMDADVAGTQARYNALADDFKERRIDILIGTQMMLSALDFAGVGVMSVLDVESMTRYPDFRAVERTFQLVQQITMLAHQSQVGCDVILQTGDTEQPFVRQMLTGDYEGMMGQLLDERKLFKYPPYYRLIYVYLKGEHERELEQAASLMTQQLMAAFGNRVQGYDRPPVSRIRRLFIRKIVLKIELGATLDVHRLLAQTQQAMQEDKRFRSLIIYYDVDPQ